MQQNSKYQEILENVNSKINNFELKNEQDLNKLSTYLFDMKEPFVTAAEETIEFYTYCAIQNLCLCIDECRDSNMNLEQMEKKIKRSWNNDYSKF